MLAHVSKGLFPSSINDYIVKFLLGWDFMKSFHGRVPECKNSKTERMYNDSELASLYLRNLNRRGTEKPVAKINDLQFKCLVTTEEY